MADEALVTKRKPWSSVRFASRDFRGVALVYRRCPTFLTLIDLLHVLCQVSVRRAGIDRADGAGHLIRLSCVDWSGDWHGQISLSLTQVCGSD